jgi:GNAT superfamily N-acetyltransferase
MLETISDETRVRLPVENDLHLLIDSMLRSNKSALPHREIESRVYFPEARKKVVKLLEVSGCLILCNSLEPEQIYGYVIFSLEPVCLHYVYVKTPFRRFGFATHLINQALAGRAEGHEVFSSHMPANLQIWERLKDKYELIYNPYLGERT